MQAVNPFARALLLPPRAGLVAVRTAFRTGRFVGAVPVRTARRTSHLLGFRGTVALVVGVALGLLLAPIPGRELRARLKVFLAGTRAVSDSELAERVGFELEHAPRTWHLPQPRIAVASARVVLTGEVELEAAREEIGRVAAAVPGVAAVENLLVVSGPGDGFAGHTD
jgi:hypothetical protein